MSHDLTAQEEFKHIDLPFRLVINFRAVFTYLENKASDPNNLGSTEAQEILERLKDFPELRGDFFNFGFVEKYEEQLKLMFSVMFPEALAENEIKAINFPFHPTVFNASKRFKTIIENAGQDYKLLPRDFDPSEMYITSCVFILNTVYKVNVNFKRPIYYDIPDKISGLLRSYRAFFNGDFIKMENNKNSPKLSKEDIEELLDNFDNLEIWKKKIPPRSYTFHGFGLLTIFDITFDESLSKLKYYLLKKDALHSPKIVSELESSLRSIFGISDLRMGFAATSDNRIHTMGHGFWNSIAMSGKMESKCSTVFCAGSLEKVFTTQETVALSTIPEKHKDQSALIRTLLDQKVGSYIAAPLKDGDRVIGVLELASEKSCVLNSVVANKLVDIVPLFSIALERSLDEYQTNLEAIIKEKCTSIHHTVEWRFLEAAAKLYVDQQFDKNHQMEDISFPDIHPLFGQADIRGSSTERTKAIQTDLVEQLSAALNVIEEAISYQALPAFEEIKYRLSRAMSKLKESLNAGDENSLLDFLKSEVYPVFKHVRTLSPELNKAVSNYESLLDPQLNVIYNKRKAYEETVHRINDEISAFLENAQGEAQEMFPHYFEKYKTDGVEYNMYIGQSLVNDKVYDPLYLSNLRIWQLLTTWGIENRIHQVKNEFQVPMDITSMILVHSNSLAIKFRLDEKKFDVDGAYNIRYEIIKKRIDKAFIKNSTERLTQPGKIAIVYSQDKEAMEYKKYLTFLISKGLIGKNIEMLELEELQGASGLRAIRVEIKFQEVATKAAARLKGKKVLSI